MNKSASEQLTPRRGNRSKKPSLRAVESAYISKLKNSGYLKPSSSSGEDFSDLDEAVELRKKPLVLNDDGVQGDKIFSFHKMKRSGALLKKAQEVQEMCGKTPHAVRAKLKRGISAKLRELSSSDEDFYDSGSEYEAEQNSDESSDSSEKSEESDESEEAEEPEEAEESKFTSGAPPTKLKVDLKKSNAKKRAVKKYVIQTDDYFANHASKKIITSNHTLDKLETPRLPQDQLQKLLKNVKLSASHAKGVSKLISDYSTYFAKWLYLLHSDFNVLLYGLGSKRKLLHEFHKSVLSGLPVIVINGFFPTLSIKDVLDGILSLLESKDNPSNLFEACDLIEEEFGYIPDVHLYLIVHNIDGAMLRNPKAQSVLSRLASIPNVHLIASIDHINAPLIWDHTKLGKFNFTWWDVTNYQPYIDETTFEGSMMVQRSGTLALSSLRNVFLSLTTNSKGIYLKIVRHQLENANNQYYQGMAFKDLYWACREAFLVSSDLALRAQLTEFVDHKMAKFKRSVDGVEHLVIPIANGLLQKFLDEHTD